MKKLISYMVISSAFVGSAWAQKSISITNPTDNNRLELVSIPFSKFTKHFGVDTIFTIKDQASGKVYLHQLEKLGQSQPQNVLVQVPISSKGKLNLVVSKDKAPSFPSKTYARYVPERFDDFAWENDVVAFRMYGKALEGRADDAQGMDYWAKRTENLVVNKWYKGDDYHKDHGEGLDYYSVGQTLGAGDIALYHNNTIQFTKHYRTYQILDNGPLRTTFKLTFEPQTIENQEIALTKTISIDAGQNFNKIVVDLNNKQANKTPVVVGLAKRNESKPEVEFDKDDKTLVYWEPNINDAGHTGTALVLTNQKVQYIDSNEKQFLLKTEISNNKTFVYYNGAAWNKAGKITSFGQWEDAVEDYAEHIRKPLKVKLK
ncbi:DUF4861 family protein [Sphingobacterium sp. SGL-16]|uniref:DUF4861 family protein n=1 Tax=Sphingobacterium sp. SGL-16 TaxID=2710883 RepID=UPI0013EA6714|nr:DUF4861 family protein [Sphingobacterium sp. SGL-16]NGM73226.1 DUF4861 domain-containing protein [Sphingobacterium sp. SGL-16]